jgi:hypothetical protein
MVTAGEGNKTGHLGLPGAPLADLNVDIALKHLLLVNTRLSPCIQVIDA